MKRLALSGWPAVLVLGLAIAVTYANVFGNSWHYDDLHAITENPHLQSLSEPIRFFSDPTQFSRDADKAMFRPLLLTTFALNYAWSGLQTESWHVINLILHAGCTLLLWGILRQLGHGGRLALLGAALFALHPVATEPVNYISSRSESLSALFVLGSFWSHLWSRRTGKPLWRIGSVAAFALGLLSKSVAITTPALLLVYDILQDGWRPALRPRRYAGYAVVAIGYLFIVGQHLSRAAVTDAVRGPLAQLATQAKAGPYYLKLLAFPVGLNVHHQFFEGGGSRTCGPVVAEPVVSGVGRRAPCASRHSVRLCMGGRRHGTHHHRPAARTRQRSPSLPAPGRHRTGADASAAGHVPPSRRPGSGSGAAAWPHITATEFGMEK